MTAAELRDIVVCAEYKQDLEELSSYLASIKQERPIVYCLAKHLWKRQIKFDLEANKMDLLVHGKRIEFKVLYDFDMVTLQRELKKYADKPLEAMWSDALAKKKASKGTWSLMAGIYNDFCQKQPETNLFVWIICSRDLSKVEPDDLKRIFMWEKQCKWNAKHSYSDNAFLKIADEYLVQLKTVRQFAMLKEEVVTNGDFSSIYHFRICEF